MRDWSGECRDDALRPRLRPRASPLSDDRARAAIGHREGSARASSASSPGATRSAAVACVGGGSNAIGLFSAYLDSPSKTKLYGVEAGGRGSKPGDHAARFSGGALGVLHGTRTMLLQDEAGQVLPTHSVSAGLDYPAVGPEHASLHDSGRVTYVKVSDENALDAFEALSACEGILPALESAHAIAFALDLAAEDAAVLVDPRQPLGPRRQGPGGVRTGAEGKVRISEAFRKARARGAGRRLSPTSQRVIPRRLRRSPWRRPSSGPGRTCWSSACRFPIPSPTAPSFSARPSAPWPPAPISTPCSAWRARSGAGPRLP